MDDDVEDDDVHRRGGGGSDETAAGCDKIMRCSNRETGWQEIKILELNTN